MKSKEKAEVLFPAKEVFRPISLILEAKKEGDSVIKL